MHTSPVTRCDLPMLTCIRPLCPHPSDPPSSSDASPWLGPSPPLTRSTPSPSPCALALHVPDASHPWSVIDLLVPRSKPTHPPFTTLRPSCTYFLACPSPSLVNHLNTHNTYTFTSQETCHTTNSIRHNTTTPPLAISVIKHIWICTQQESLKPLNSCANHSSQMNGTKALINLVSQTFFKRIIYLALGKIILPSKALPESKFPI
jgi:hypothetical protein